MPDLSAITAADLKARYPAFAGKPDGYVNAVLDEARGEVNEGWIEGDQVPALLAYAAYLIASEASAAASVQVGDGLNVGISGALSEVWVGDVKAKFSDAAGSGGGSGGSGGSAISPAAALYWNQFLRLRRRSFPEVAIV